MNDKEYIEYFDSRVKGVKKDIRTQQWIMLVKFASHGFSQMVTAIRYSYKMGYKAGKRAK